MLNLGTAAAALGVSRATMLRWLRQWRATGTGKGPKPIFLGANGQPPIRYCIDDIVIPSETMPCFLDRMRADLARFIESTAASEEQSSVKSKAKGGAE
jgi:transposase-like protein